MIVMSGNMNIIIIIYKKGSGGLMKVIKWMVVGEFFFLNYFEIQQGDGEIWFGIFLVGDMEVMELDQENFIVQGSFFLVCEYGVDIDLGW